MINKYIYKHETLESLKKNYIVLNDSVSGGGLLLATKEMDNSPFPFGLIWRCLEDGKIVEHSIFITKQAFKEIVSQNIKSL